MKTGERQEASELGGIEASHALRYLFALKYVKPSTRVLDFGCGCGYGTKILANTAKEVVGLDKSLDAISYAMKYWNASNIDYRLSSVVVDSNYDYAVCLELIEHVESPEEVLENIHDVLNEDGHLFISSPDESFNPYSKEKYPFHVRHFTQPEFTYLLESCGFKVIQKFHQISKTNPSLKPGWGGKTMVALCRKQ